MRIKLKKILPLFLITVISSCEIINPEEKIPSYIYINDFTFTCNLELQGYPSTKITDAWFMPMGFLSGLSNYRQQSPFWNQVKQILLYIPE